MSSQTVLERNLLALSSKDTNLSFKISHSAPLRELTFIKSKTGEPVPVLHRANRQYFLHSRFDPRREGLRIAESYRPEGYILFIGFGAGYHIEPFLDSSEASQLVIIDKDIAYFRSLFEQMDMRNLLLNPRVQLLVTEQPDEIESFFFKTYLPVLFGDLQTISLRSRIETEPDYFKEVIAILKQSISKVSDDYTVQSYFGKKWFINTLSNLETAQFSSTTLRPIRKAVVTGAGPSLESHFDRIKELQQSACLIATDTSFPALRENGITPDLVISIDCQQISYLHFIGGFPDSIPLVLDLASPPDLKRLTKRLFFFTSGHPFSQYVNSHWRRFPYIDTTGGNVSHAAISLADALGAHEIYLFGADFSYPEGKAYSRGTYIYPYFRIRENRFNPLDTLFYSFILRNFNMVKDRIGDKIRYSTKPMLSYKTRLEQSIRNITGKIIQFPGDGLSLDLVPKEDVPEEKRKISTLYSAGRAKSDWKDFLCTYMDNLQELSPPKEPVAKYLVDLSPHERDLWFTLLPAAAALQREKLDHQSKGSIILNEVHAWSMAVLDHYLEDIV
jgi:hypothetical protein